MGSGIVAPPNQYPAGLDFDYSVWVPGTRVDLVNVPWNNDYRDVVKFANKDALNSYINSKISSGVTIEQMTYAKPGQDIYLGIPYNAVNRYNYLRASNPLQPIPGDVQKDFYYFILECEYIAPGTTRLRLQLDIWQTYVYDVTFGNCYVERGHAGIANDNAFNNYGRDYLTIPEGLDIGGEYVERFFKSITSFHVSDCDVLAISTTDLRADPGTVTNPILTSAPGSVFQMLPSGASAYVWKTASNFTQWMNANKTKPWVTQGIISLTLIPSVSRYHSGFTYDGATDNDPSTVPATPAQAINHDIYDDWRNDIISQIDSRYRHLLKFLTYPYLVIEFTTYTGSPIIIKPESWANDNASVQEIAALVPPNQRIAYTPLDYNTSNEGSAGYKRDGDWLNLAVYISNFPTLPVVNNQAINYLASNANQLAWQKANAEWTQNRALGMAQGQYDIASGAMNTMGQLTGIGIGADIAQTGITNRNLAAQAIMNAVAGGVAGIGSALTPGGFGGSAISGIANAAATGTNAALQTSANDEALAVRNAQANAQLGANVGQAGLLRDTNKTLADWAARGDYATQIAGINAKVQDAALIQPSTSGQNGGETFNLINQIANFVARWKFIDNATLRRVGDIWLRYGYTINAFMEIPQSLRVMEKFSYWKMTETYLVSTVVPEGHKQALRGILEKGTTVWVDPDNIGNIDIADNAPLNGFSY